LKFTYQGGVSVLVEMTSEDCIKFCVRDTGIGIKEEDQKGLFKMYGRGDQADPNTNTQGIGFGLEISDRLARLLAGDLEEGEASGIKLASKVGKGTSFTFIIKDKNEKDHESFHINFFEPQVFAENIENLSLKISPYSFSMISNSEQDTIPKPSRSALLSYISKDAKFLLPSVNLRPFRKSTGDKAINQVLNTMTQLKLNNNLIISRNTSSRADLLLTSPRSATQRENMSSENGLLSLSPCTIIKDRQVSLTKNLVPQSILLIDDNSFNLLVAKHLLESLGYKVKTALNGKLAVELVKSMLEENKKPFDAILMDLQMPVMDGYEATRLLREMMVNKEMMSVPIIALSANDSEDDKARCREVGMYSHLSKPLKETSLKDALEQVFVSVTDDDDNTFESISDLCLDER